MLSLCKILSGSSARIRLGLNTVKTFSEIVCIRPKVIASQGSCATSGQRMQLSPPLLTQELTESQVCTFYACCFAAASSQLECDLRRLRPHSQAVQGSVSDAQDVKYSWHACSSPASFSGLQEGHWLLTLQATNAAGLSRKSR